MLNDQIDRRNDMTNEEAAKVISSHITIHNGDII